MYTFTLALFVVTLFVLLIENTQSQEDASVYRDLDLKDTESSIDKYKRQKKQKVICIYNVCRRRDSRKKKKVNLTSLQSKRVPN
jgi:hypothetical protein